MKKVLIKLLSTAVAASIGVSVLAGCSADKKKDPAKSPEVSTSSNTKQFWELYDKVSDTSDLPTWTGNKLKLKVWYSHGTGDPKRGKSENDVVYKEIERVTGIQIDLENSFDNGGQDIKAKMPSLVATNDWPDLVYNSQLSNLEELVKAGKIWDISEAFTKYCSEYIKKAPTDKNKELYDKVKYNGKQYGVPSNINQSFLPLNDPKLDMDKYRNLSFTTTKSDNSSIYVRDDILKKLYPNARTQAELEALYLKNNGKFSKEEIFDVPLKNMDDVVKMMYDIQKLIDKEGIKENNKPVKVTYGPPIGRDNWDIMKTLPQAIDGVLSNNNYFTQFNKKTGKIEIAYKMDYVKNELKVFNKLLRDDIISKDSVVDSLAIWQEKMANGLYAFTYGTSPDEAALVKAGKTYKYRRVWVDQKYREDQQIATTTPPGAGVWAIFKDAVKEENLPQVMRFFEYMNSDLGEKLLYWGPKSANVWEEKDGKRKFTDKDLEECMVNGKDNGRALYYGLYNPYMAVQNPFPGYPTFMWGGSTLHPKYVYDKAIAASQAKQYFNPSILPGYSKESIMVMTPAVPNIYDAAYKSVTEVTRFWNARESFEKQMTKVIVSSDDAQFEAQYKALLDLAEKNGLTDKTLEELNKVYLQVNGEALKKAGVIK
jgi:putative aldouronate transport system substrate-binding protein